MASTRNGISQAKISKIENGLVSPSEADVEILARALRFRSEFFFHPHVRRAEPPTYERKRKKLAKKDWTRIYAKAEIFRISTALFLRSVELNPRLPSPASIDPDEYNGNIESIALAIRQNWRLPRGPVADVTSILENAGVIVVGFDFGTDLCDGFSQHASEGMPPVVFANTRQPKDKLRFTLSHELGHIVMHMLPNPDMEKQANRFASEFLMPSADIAKDMYNLSLEKFITLKPYWKTSIQSLIYKAHQMNRMSDSAFRYYMINMGKRGWRTKEPVELAGVQESPRILLQLVRAHLGPLNYGLDDMGVLVGLGKNDVEEFYGLSAQPKFRIVT